MLSILPAFSSPDLKVFLLLKKSFKSSAGGQGRDCVRSVSLLPLVTSFLPTGVSHFSHRLAKERFSVGALVVLGVGLCQSRKDPYLPPELQCVRLLPRPTGLPPVAFAVSFRIRCRGRENRRQTPQAKES